MNWQRVCLLDDQADSCTEADFMTLPGQGPHACPPAAKQSDAPPVEPGIPERWRRLRNDGVGSETTKK